jgi:hypothetical protein
MKTSKEVDPVLRYYATIAIIRWLHSEKGKVKT